MMRFPTHVTMNTYATSARFCAYADRSCNRLCTPEELPGVLRTGPYSEIVPEHLPCSKKGGGTKIHGQSTEMVQAVQDSTFERGESGDSVERLFGRKQYTAEGYSSCDSTEPILTAL